MGLGAINALILEGSIVSASYWRVGRLAPLCDRGGADGATPAGRGDEGLRCSTDYNMAAGSRKRPAIHTKHTKLVAIFAPVAVCMDNRAF